MSFAIQELNHDGEQSMPKHCETEGATGLLSLSSQLLLTTRYNSACEAFPSSPWPQSLYPLFALTHSLSQIKGSNLHCHTRERITGSE